jgi:hypothetical protein
LRPEGFMLDCGHITEMEAVIHLIALHGRTIWMS